MFWALVVKPFGLKWSFSWRAPIHKRMPCTQSVSEDVQQLQYIIQLAAVERLALRHDDLLLHFTTWRCNVGVRTVEGENPRWQKGLSDPAATHFRARGRRSSGCRQTDCLRRLVF